MAPSKKSDKDKKGLPLMRGRPGNTLRAFTSASMEWTLRTMPLRHSKRAWKFSMKEKGTPDMCIDTRLNRALWVKGIRNVLH